MVKSILSSDTATLGSTKMVEYIQLDPKMSSHAKVEKI